MRDSAKQRKLSLIFVIIFVSICLLSPLAFTLAYFVDYFTITSRIGTTPTLYVSVKSNFETTNRTITIVEDEEETNVVVPAFVLTFEDVNTNGLVYEYEDNGTQVGDAPIYLVNYLNVYENASWSTKTSNINGLLRAKISIEWEDSSPSSNSLNITLGESNLAFAGWSYVGADVQSVILSDTYFYYNDVVAYNQVTVADFSTFIPFITSISCTNSVYLNKTVTIGVYAEIIQADTLGLNKWAGTNVWAESTTLPTGWASAVSASANFYS